MKALTVSETTAVRDGAKLLDSEPVDVWRRYLLFHVASDYAAFLPKAFDDANFEKAADVTVNAIVQNAGQTCSAGSRVLIQRTVYEKFMAELTRRFNRLKVGPHDLDLDVGAVITKNQQTRVQAFLDRAAADKIEAVAMGSMPCSCKRRSMGDS